MLTYPANLEGSSESTSLHIYVDSPESLFVNVTSTEILCHAYFQIQSLKLKEYLHCYILYISIKHTWWILTGGA